ncbi:hypothetical protein NP233_g12822 [Leucocoprinus birnbaumii]|uniref:Uncharacterized protein n=1 Tax=Leucocoprinus birnbaumii TaxID=56174 RepID=A0AAD5YJ55_9AGAR|nr:hypothetical protein NP233_g12822 [Leucocoprinus birnbaumii]
MIRFGSDEPEEEPKYEELAKDSDLEPWAFSRKHIAKALKLSCSPPPGDETTDLRLVNIIAVRRIRTVSFISHFHSIPVMSFITGTGAVCAYPELIFRMRGVINERQSNASTEKFTNCLNEYRSRGFDMAMTFGRE